MELTVPQYAKHFDMALHLQSSTEEDIRKHAQTARDTNVAACYTNSFWTPVVADVLKGSDVRVGTAISFPYGCTSTAMKFAEIEEGLDLGATAVDMVVNVGAVRDGDYALVERELEGLVDRCKDKAITKLIFEVGFLTDEQIAHLTKMCCEIGVDYVKTATGSEAFPNEHQVRIMRDNLTGDKTKLKVSGVPRTFTMPATLWMIEKLGVSLIGTRSAARLVKEYEEYLKRGVLGVKETYLVGIDAGTTGCKTVVFDLDGNALGSDYREYPSKFPKEGWVEQAYDDIIPPLVDSCRVAIKKSGVNRNNIAAVAFSSQAPLLTMLDEDGFLMRDFVSWQDLRGAPYIKELREAYGSDRYYQETGDPLNTNSAAPKWAWLRDHEPENFNRARWLLSEQEYLLKIWGAEEYWTDLSSASREGMLDVNSAEWSKPIHDLVGIPLEKRAKLSKVPGQVVGAVTGDIALRAGLPDGVPLCVGGHDQNCCTFGAGAIKGGDTAMVMGTFGSCYVVMDKPMRDPKRKLIVKPNHGMPNWTIEAFSNTSASAFRWYRDTFCQLEVASGEVVGIDPYDLLTREASSSKIGASGVTFLPFLAGASGARQNADARANFFGMSLSTNKHDIARAVLEGICFEMRDILNAQEAAGVEVGTIRLVGGAANSKFWSQMLADSLGHPIEILSSNQAGCLGAAMYAGVGVGAYKDCEEAAKRAVKVSARYEPNPEVAAAYDNAFEKFVKCYDSLDGNLF